MTFIFHGRVGWIGVACLAVAGLVRQSFFRRADYYNDYTDYPRMTAGVLE
jgi:hypothetical protein